MSAHVMRWKCYYENSCWLSHVRLYCDVRGRPVLVVYQYRSSSSDCSDQLFLLLLIRLWCQLRWWLSTDTGGLCLLHVSDSQQSLHSSPHWYVRVAGRCTAHDVSEVFLSSLLVYLLYAFLSLLLVWRLSNSSHDKCNSSRLKPSFLVCTTRVCITRRRHQSSEWTILSYVTCFIQTEFISGPAG